MAEVTAQRPAVRRLRGALLAVLALSPLALGGTHPLTQAGLAMLALAIAVPLLLLHPGGEEEPGTVRLRLPLPALALAAIALWSMLRSTALFGFLAPEVVREAHGLWDGLALRGVLVPAQGGLHALKLLAVAAVLAATWRHFSNREGVRLVAIAAIGAAVVTGLTGLAHVVFEADRILFFYQPLHRSIIYPWGGPFVNPNQTATVLGLGSLLLLCGAVVGSRPQVRVALVVLALLPAAILPQLDAKGATGALIIATGFLLVGLVVVRIPRRPLRIGVLAGLACACAATVLVLMYEVIPRMIADRDDAFRDFFYKTEIWHWSLALLRETGPFGAGPFSFGDLYPAVTPQILRGRHSYVEAAPLQVLLDHGWLAGGAFLLAMLLPLRRLLSTACPLRSRRLLAVWAVLLFAAIEAITGMGQQSMSVALLLGALYGASIGHAHASRRLSARADAEAPASAGWSGFPVAHRATIATGGVLLAAAIVTAPAGVRQLLADRDIPLLTEIRTHGPASAEVDAAMAQRSRWRPGEPELVAQAAAVFLLRGDMARAQRMRDYMVHRLPMHRLTRRTRLHVARRAGDDAELCAIAGDYIVLRRGDPIRILRTMSEDASTWWACVPDVRAHQRHFVALVEDSARPFEQLELATYLRRTLREDPLALRLTISAMIATDLADLAVDYAEDLLALEPLHADDLARVLRLANHLRDPALGIRVTGIMRAADPTDTAVLAQWIDLQLAEPELADPIAMREALRAPRGPAGSVRERVRWLLREGDVHHLLGDRQQARVAWERGLAASPGHRALDRRLQALDREEHGVPAEPAGRQRPSTEGGTGIEGSLREALGR
ncbi:MAG: hypothetical protein EA398_17545 [Deltaproteobacteria bacterium]|nr:MAG: hypothetical protein EA398_17545 [Deltaproteobacteria bacterium]